MSTRLATRMSLRYLAAALVAGLAFTLAPTAPAVADEDPVVRQTRARVAPPRVRAPVRHVRHVRTVVRARPAPVYYYTTTCGGCAAPQPVVYRAAYSCGTCAPAVAAPVYYAPRTYYAAGCGTCGQPYAKPYYWAVRTARYWHAHGYYR